MDIRSGQKLAWENKVAKGFNTTDVPLEFCLFQGEVAEAFDAWRKGSAGRTSRLQTYVKIHAGSRNLDDVDGAESRLGADRPQQGFIVEIERAIPELVADLAKRRAQPMVAGKRDRRRAGSRSAAAP